MSAAASSASSTASETRVDGAFPPGSTIGILGGGQLGRMLAMAARRLGYRVVSLDPDASAPAGAVSDRLIVAAYADLEAVRELATVSDVLTYELEHIDAGVVEAIAGLCPVRPGLRALRVTQDRLAERRFLAELGIAVAPWSAVITADDARTAAGHVGFPCRLKRSIGGYDGRSQWFVADARALEALMHEHGDGRPMLLERELDFVVELSVVCTRSSDGGSLTFPAALNLHDAGILIESRAPAPLPDHLLDAASAIARRMADALAVVGTLTAEMFLLPDGTLAVNELAPRVHNSGHYTEDACLTSQFEQHVRAICGLPLGDVAMHGQAVMLNLLGSGARRPARSRGLEDALSDPLVRVHLYDKHEVFERRKMGHVTVVTDDLDDAHDRAKHALAQLSWAP